MTQINVSSDSKDWFDDWKGDRTQSEAFEDLVAIVKSYEGEPVDVEALAEELEHSLVSKIELGAFRGAKAYHENNKEVLVYNE